MKQVQPKKYNINTLDEMHDEEISKYPIFEIL